MENIQNPSVFVKAVTSTEEKSHICRRILKALPDWFGNESAVTDYIQKVQSMQFHAVYHGEQAIGFAALTIHNEHAAEIGVMGILPDYHRKGLGKRLIASCEEFCAANGMQFLTVKTLDASAGYTPYESTRLFYQSMGFLPLEVLPLFWDKDNPCLFMTKYIAKTSA